MSIDPLAFLDQPQGKVEETSDPLSFLDEKVGRGRSLASAPVKGGIKGALDLAAMSDPFKAALGVAGPTKMQEKAIEWALPTQDKPLEKGLERAGKIAVSAVGGPETLLAKGLRTGAAATLGQLAEESGAPEWVQGLAELSAFMAPKLKGFSPKKAQMEATKFLREKGFTDKEIVPLLQTERKIRTLGKLSKPNAKTQKLLSNLKEKLGAQYDVLKQKGSDKFLTGKNLTKFDDNLLNTMDKINPRFQRLVQSDVEALRNRGISGRSLIDFYQDINATVKGQEGGKSVVGMLKGPVLEALKEVDPEIASNFSKINNFYGKRAALAKAMKPHQLDSLFRKGKIIAGAAAIVSGQLWALKGLVGEQVLGHISRELLINPKLQNIALKMQKALIDNKIPAARALLKTFAREVNVPELLVPESDQSASDHSEKH